MSPVPASLRRPLNLRSRLLLTIAVISTLAALTVGAGAVIALRTIGVQQVDSQLIGAEQRSVNPQGSPDGGAPGSSPSPGPSPGPSAGPPSGPSDQVNDVLQRPGQSAGTLIARSDSGTDSLEAAVLDQTGQVRDLPSADLASLSAASLGPAPVTVSLPGLGDYRVVADAGADGARIITGLPLSTVQDTAVRLAVVVALVTLLVLALALTAGSALVRIALRPLDRVRATASRVSELALDQGDVALAERVPNPQPDTEIGQVTAALNRMLEHVARALQSRQGSEMRLRRFVADASHELRTPLASIRGYSELLRRRTDPLPEDVAHALRRVESEAIRMGSLVEDLLLLARLDEHRPLDQDIVDLVEVIAEATGDARAAGPEHVWRDTLPDSEVLVVGDQARLTQVVVNLLANARTHTPPGTEVDVLLRTATDAHGEYAELQVRDNGPGMPADLVAEAFERFTRADSSRSRAAGSTGLGLSIVDAVVRAHGGAARLKSTPGHGTAVTVRLPRAVLDAQPDLDAFVQCAGGPAQDSPGARDRFPSRSTQ